jgi:hypothetical protein
MFRDTGDEPETSLLRNTIAAQEVGSDYTDPYDARGGALSIDLGRVGGGRWTLSAGYEWQDSLSVHATPVWGQYGPTIAAWELHGTRGSITYERPTALSVAGFETRLAAELRGAHASVERADSAAETLTYGRAALAVQAERPIGGIRVASRSSVSTTLGSDLPPQEFVYLGGPTTAPGYDFHELVGRFGASQRVEARFSIPFVALTLGRYGNTGSTATLAPFAHAAYVARAGPSDPAERRRVGWYPSVGVGLLTVFDLLRFDVAKGLRDGRWDFSVVVLIDFWSIL